MSHACVDCNEQIARTGRRGPAPKRCQSCRKRAAAVRLQNRPRAKNHSKSCKRCRQHFTTSFRHQKYCSRRCAHEADQTRFEINCANVKCGRLFYVVPSQYAKGTRCCSSKCKHEHMRLPDAFCQNPACGKKIDRESQGPRKTALGQDGRKYCCRECAWDHRWGADRPRRNWSKEHLAAASAGALRTSLRKKCKVLGVPYDEECTRLAVLQRDGWTCQRCRIKCNREYVIDSKTRRPDPRNAEHDHIVPLAKKGSPGNVFPNSQCLCRKCNNKKRKRSWGQFRLDLEGSVKRWESGARGRRRRNSSSYGAILAAGV